MKKLLVVEVAALGWEFMRQHGVGGIGGIEARPLESVFPAVTCNAQATLRTGLPAAQHGMIANGFYAPVLRKPLFWEQSSALVSGERFWQEWRSHGNTVAMAFFQQSLGEQVDMVISPAPIHKHGGGMIMDCACQPPDLYERLRRAVGGKFSLHRYWGPLASTVSSAWIAKAVSALLSWKGAPHLCLAYLPCLDYDLQRYGPAHPRSIKALRQLCVQVEELLRSARRNGYEAVFFGDYAITPVTRGAVFPNRLLLERGFLKTRDIKGMRYPDFHHSRAFVVADHQVGLVSCPHPDDKPLVKRMLSELDGVARVIDHTEEGDGISPHAHLGDLLLVAEPGAWFAYHWWSHDREAPEYARHMDIHNKPGFDPCELFFGRTPFETSLDTSRVKGTHGLSGPGYESALLSTLSLEAGNLMELVSELKAWLME